MTNVTWRVAALRWLDEVGLLPADARQSLESRVEDALATPDGGVSRYSPNSRGLGAPLTSGFQVYEGGVPVECGHGR